MNNYLNEYYEKIKNKEILVSSKVLKQLEKLIYDIKNPEKYHFDLNLASRPIEFIERFCKHSKGKWAGKNIKLELWQKAIIQATFGFVDEKNIRKYQQLNLIVGRKNGKSTLISGIGLYMMLADGEGGAQVCCVASKRDQAKIVFDEAKNMVTQSPYLNKHIKKRKTDLYAKITFSKFEPLSSDSNTLDGLNIHCGIIDELHSLKDRNIYDVTKQSMSARTQPLLFIITTAGFNRESIFDSEYEYAKNILEGNIEDDKVLSFIYELENENEIYDDKNWIKANPGLGTIKSYEYIENVINKAKKDATFMPTVLCKDFNIRQTAEGSWLTFEKIDNIATFKIDELSNTYGIGGVDLSSVGDLTCATVLIEKNNEIFCLQKYWIPEEKATQKEHEDKVPYTIWRKKGFVNFCSGNKIDVIDVVDWFIELREKYNIYVLWVGYDNWGADYFVEKMKQNNFNLIPVIQGAKTFSNPMKNLALDLEAKKINYNNNPVLKWCLTNTKIKQDENDNIRPTKGKNSKQRVDGTFSLLDAYVIYQNNYEDYKAMCLS